MIKKITPVILIISITLSMLVIPASAATYSTNMSFESYMKAHYRNFEPEIEITYYVKNKGITLQDAIDTHIDLVNNNAEFFYVNVSAQGRSIGSRYFVTGVNYVCTKSKLPAVKKEMEKAANSALATLNDSMSDAEKVMAIHDYMILATDYDTATESRNNGYEALVNKSAICQGYARGLQYLLSAAGFENMIIREKSSNMNHGWNIVKIDEGWFHVDTTKDDPVSSKMDSFGRVSHKYSLSSDEYIASLGHTWERDKYPKATNTAYDKAAFRNTRSPMIKFNDDWYFMEADSKNATVTVLYKYDLRTNKKTKVYSLEAIWPVWGQEKSGKKWPGSYSSLVHYNGMMYFNDAKSIYRFNPTTNKATKVATPKNLKGYIYGINMTDNVITYTVKEKPVFANTFKTLSVTKATSTKLALNRKSLTGGVGKSYSVKAALTPSSGKDYIYWTTSDPSVVTVVNGKITCVAKGKAIITAYTSTNQKVSLTVNVK